MSWRLALLLCASAVFAGAPAWAQTRDNQPAAAAGAKAAAAAGAKAAAAAHICQRVDGAVASRAERD